jgi:hypothetical protein
MKVDLIEQNEPFSDETWYGVRVNGSSVKWSRDKAVVEAIYNDIISNPDVLKTKENILKSQVVDVSLEETNQ